VRTRELTRSTSQRTTFKRHRLQLVAETNKQPYLTALSR